MNILLIYLTSHPAISSSPPYFLEKALKKHQVEVFGFNETPYWGDLRHKLPFYIPKGLPVSVQSVIKKFNKRFDLIIEITTAMQYHLTGYKKLPVTNALWALDVYRFDQRKFMLWLKDDFDYIFSSQKNFVDIFNPAKSFWLPYACDPEVHKKFELPKIYDIVFVGNTNIDIYSERVRLLKLIAEKFNLKVFNNVYGADLAKIYSQAKIVFNKSADGEINMRIFEAMSCGSLLITDHIKRETGIEYLFQDKQHLVFYDNEKDLLEKIDYYLKHDKEREKIALCGHMEVIQKHTYEHRAKTMLKIMTKNI